MTGPAGSGEWLPGHPAWEIGIMSPIHRALARGLSLYPIVEILIEGARLSTTWRQFFTRLWDERVPILGGLTFAAVFCSLSPLIWRVRVYAIRWISEPDHVSLGALVALLLALGGVAILVWPGPAAARWMESWWRCVVSGSFALPALGAICVFDLGFNLPFGRWLVFAGLVCVSVTVAVSIPIFRSVANKPKADAADEPMQRLTQAWPERRELARRIADCVLKEGKPTYAVYGEFGSGKSSMLNFIEEFLRQAPGTAPVIVRFNGWLPGSRKNLVDQLLGDIAAECSRRYFVPQLRRISSKIAKAVTRGIPHLDGLAEWFPQETQKELVEGLRRALERIPVRVVVLVDEIDRMRKEELFVLLKLIRGFASLPRLSFLCALERHHVENLIRQEFGAIDHTFFHKFFADFYHLPKLSDSFLESEAHDGLVAVFDRQGWFLSDSSDKAAFSESIRGVWGNILAPICSNVRLVNRLISAVRTEAGPIIGEVDPVDLILVAALRCFAPAMLDLVWHSRDTLCAQDSPTNVSEPNDVFAESVASFLTAEAHLDLSEPLLDHARLIRKFLFSGLDEIAKAGKPDASNWINSALRYFDANKQAAQKRRLRSMAYFPAYFHSAVPDGIYPEQDLRRVFEELGRSDDSQIDLVLRSEFERLECSVLRRLNFLEKFSGRAVQMLDAERCAKAASTLVTLPGGVDGAYYEQEYDCAARLVISLSDELALAGRADDCHRLLSNSIERAGPDGVAQKIFRFAQGSRPILDAVTAALRGTPRPSQDVLEVAFLRRMEKRYGPEVAVGQVDLSESYWLAFHDWGVSLEKSVRVARRDLQREFWERYISSPERMASFAHYVIAPWVLNRSLFSPSISIEKVLTKDEIRALAGRFPPYRDQMAVAYIRDLLGADAIPEPVGFGR